LLEMPEWKRQQLLPALSPTQKKWLAEHSSNSSVTPTRDGHEHPPPTLAGRPSRRSRPSRYGARPRRGPTSSLTRAISHRAEPFAY
jgi:hypothetical protein